MKNSIKFYSIVENLVPEYVKEEFPLVVEFLSQYYKSQENQSAALDIIHNIDKYVQVDNITNLKLKTTLTYPTNFDTEIFLESGEGLPKRYGLIKINDEIIWYDQLEEDSVQEVECTIEVGASSFVSFDIINQILNDSTNSGNAWINKIVYIKDLSGNIVNSVKITGIDSGLSVITDNPLIPSEEVSYYNQNNIYTCTINGTKLLNCTRGFGATTSYNSNTNVDELVYEESLTDNHNTNSEVVNLSILFLTEFLKKVKYQLTPGFEDEEFYEKINEATFINNIKQFYSSKGTNCSFELLFRALFGEDVNVILPRDYVIQASDAQYNIFRDLVVESLEGNPEDLENLTLHQDQYLNIPEARGTVAKVEQIQRGNSIYYKISLDQTKENTSDSNIGKFTVHPKSKTTIDIQLESDFIDVDSTVGFPESGELEISVKLNTIQGIPTVVFGNVVSTGNSQELFERFTVRYSSKTSTQFLGCTGIGRDIPINSVVRLNTFAYGDNGSDRIRVSIGGVLSSTNIQSQPHYSSPNEQIRIETLGSNLRDIRSENWFYNIATKYDIESISFKSFEEREDVFGNNLQIYTYEIVLYDDNIIKKGDSISLLYSRGVIQNGTVVNQTGLRSFLVVGFSQIDESLKYQLRKNISKVNSKNYPELSKYSTNVQNVYVDKDKNVYVNSQSLPNYLNEPLLITDRSVTFSGSYVDSETININSHGFYTGEAVVYQPGNGNNSFNIKKGIYFVYVVDKNTIKLARSRVNIYTNNFIKLTGNVSNNKLLLESFTNTDLSPKDLLPQNIFRKLSDPKVPTKYTETITKPGTIGLFVNGVEILNYKSKDVIFYGPLEKIFPVSPGNGYDIVNPPLLNIEDDFGSGASGYVSIKGSLERVDIIDPGFDYIETPNITISGGNGKDASASVNLVSVDHSVSFNAKTGVNTTSNVIGFSTYHRLRNNEIVFYDPKGQTKVVGLSTNSQYYVSVIDPLNVKLYKTFEDSSSGINTVNLSGIGTGRHYLNCLIKKKQIGSVQITNHGKGYETKKTSISAVGINTFSEVINIKNHGYNSGEILIYNSTGSDIGGLTSGSTYYVTKVDDDKFKLSNIGLGITEKDVFYRSKNYVTFTSIGVGTHYFNYEPITIQISGRTGIGSTYSNQAQLRPIFSGEITSVHLESGGESYGSEIINLKRQPSISVLNGKNAQAKPVIKDGKIVSVIITNIGSQYYSTPKIQIVGSGSGAVLTPIIQNNTLKEIRVISSGGGYDNGTLINVIPSGSEAKFESDIKSWRINLFERLLQNNQIPPDDGILYEGKNDKNGVEYTHLYSPRKLRESIIGQKISNGEVIYNADLELINQSESTSLTHSPIIGWAYDGNPIYGPYGYSLDSSGNAGSIKQMLSGYQLRNNLQNRPNYPEGFFVEDYEFVDQGDLDEHNGRFCVTPEFPNGVYAYFCTISSGLPENGGIFNRYKKPQFPYVLGDSYRSEPIEFNFLSTSNLNKFNLNESSLLRNTRPYGLLNGNTYYDQLTDPNKIKNQVSIIKSVSGGKVENIGIVTGGDFYRIGEKIILSDDSTNAFVSQIKGKTVNSISVESKQVSNIEFIRSKNGYIGFSSIPHNLNDGDLVTITSSYDNNISGNVLVNKNTLVLRSGIESSSVTGIVTYLNVSGSLDESKIRENDIYYLGNEQIKILNIDFQKSQLRILRNQFNTTGISSVEVGTALTENPRKFEVTFGITTSYNLNSNRQLYFDPAVSVGLGTTGGVGITSTLFLDTVNFKHPVSIGTGSTTFLYFRDLKDIQEYTGGGYVDIVDATNSSFNTTKKKIISIGSTSIKIDFNTSSLSGVGVTAYLNKWNIKVIPTQTIYLPNHNLNTGDSIVYSSNGGTRVSVSTNGVSSFQLNENSILYAAKISNDLVGVSTVPVGIGSTGNFIGIGSIASSILYITSIGTGNTHSFATNYSNTFIADISKNVVTLQTKEPHGLSRNDNVDVSVISGISTTIKITYNKKYKRVLVDPKNFESSDVSLISDIITIQNHGIKTGQKIIHTCSGSPVGGLSNNQIYYVISIGSNKLRLSETYYGAIKSNPEYINLTSTASGTISKINPEISLVKNSQLVFDVSDESLSFDQNGERKPGFKLDFYTDEQFKNKYESSKTNKTFDVKRSGLVGVDTNATVTLTSTNSPKILYYKLTPTNIRTNSEDNLKISVDDDVVNNNKIIIKNSLYDGRYNVVGVASTTFSYNIERVPETGSYNSSSSNIQYYVNSSSAFGPISEVSVISSGKNLKSLPSVVDLNNGSAILFADGTTIGSVNENDIEILDIGADYASDFSIRPTAKFSSLFEIDSFSTIESLEVSSPGKNYSTKPDLILIDSLSNEKIDDVILDYNLQEHKVNILRNTNKISGKYTPKVIPINNSNGVGINTIAYNSSNNTVTVGLAKSYNSSSEFPFKVNDVIFIENVSVGIGSTLKGYNSSEYNYSSFTIVNVHPNIGGIGASITYSMENYLNSGEVLGNYDSINSSGKVIVVSDLPTFKIRTKKKKFMKNEKIISNGSIGIIQNHDTDRDIVKVSTTDEFFVGDNIIGLSSKTTAKIKKISEFNLNYNVEASSIVRGTWNKETGFLNFSTQRIHDSDYYQYFSYAVQSKVEYEKWNESVSKLTHTSGFKKFSDLTIDSNSEASGMNPNQNNSDISGIADITGHGSLNCYYDFDLVNENNIQIGSEIFSNQINFNSRILQDYIESIGNRVLVIDDISNLFNSNPRTDRFSIVDTFSISDDSNLVKRYKKYFFTVKDSVYLDSIECGAISLLHDDNNGYLNQYGFTFTEGSLGAFDFSISSDQGLLKFYPNNFRENVYDIQLLSFGIPNIATGIGSTNIGGVFNISSNYAQISTGTTTTIVGIASTYRSSKVLVQIGSTDGNYYEFNEFTLLNDGTNVNVLEFGLLNTTSLDSYSTSGIATYNFNIVGGNMIVEINPVTGYGSSIDVNTFVVSIGNTNSSGISTQQYTNGYVRSHFVAISSSPTPTSNVAASFGYDISGCYCVATVEDLTNNQSQTSEIFISRNDTVSSIAEFGVVYSQGSLGEFTTDISGSNCRLLFTPNPNINIQIRIAEFSLGEQSGSSDSTLNLNNGSSIDFSSGSYTGTDLDIRKSFDLTYRGNKIFEKSFNGVSTNFVDTVNDIITIPNHYFVTGEEVEYSYPNSNNSTSNAVGIATTTISGIGSTDKMPTTLYIVKVSDSKVKVSASASEALSTIPNTLNITSVGVGTNHKFTTKNQNTKCLISIDNAIQAPIVATAVTSLLVESATSLDNIIKISSIENLYGADFIKLNEEIVKVRSVGFGSTNSILVQRGLLGTIPKAHNTNSPVAKVVGNYNVIDNTIHFSEPPFGKFTFSNTRPDEQDYFGLEVSSKFNGRVFLRSGIENSSREVYSDNYLFDSLSESFTGFTTQFTLKSENSNVTGIVTSNAIILINNILQFPSDVTGISDINAYKLSENSGITTITFEFNNATDYNSDINLTATPRGGIILAVGSTEGYGYQPLVTAGGTSIVSSAGTIQSISIGNSGSGYRSGIQTTVSVGVRTDASSAIFKVGIASISNGNIVSIAITNPGIGYTTSNPPLVVFDSPQSYYNLPLIYSSLSSGIGTGARINIIVGQESKVVNFDIINYGFGYEVGDILTVGVGGTVGIPTNTSVSFKEFQIIVDQVYNDQFFGWSVGELQILDPIDDLVDGIRKLFPIKVDGQQISIRSRKGSNIDVQASLLVFVNDVLQVPGEGYVFGGGSIIEFTEAPKVNDIIKILFYRGTGGIDTRLVDILEPVEVGDFVQMKSFENILSQDERVVEQIANSDLIYTNAYFGSGISSISRPVTLCKQTDDMFVDGKYVSKDRVMYEPEIFPTTNIIQNVSVASTEIFVESVKTFFDNRREYIQNGIDNVPQKSIRILSQDNVSSAIATAIVSSAGTVTSISILDGGIGYTTTPSVRIQNPIGIGSTALATSTISVGGTVSSIVVTNSGLGYSQSNPPLVIVEPPSLIYEDITGVSYEGDFGIIVGIATTSIVGVATTGIVFDLFVPTTSYLRNSSYNVGVATTGISGIQTNYLFVVSNSNIGNGVTAINSSGSVVGIGSTFLDNIYSVARVSIAQTSVPGIGITNVSRVVVNVQSYNGLTGIGYSEYFGNYSWGRISNLTRKNPKQFTANKNGYLSISTSPAVTRTNSLKYVGYSTT